MGEQPPYVWDPWCRKHILRAAYTAHAAAHHPKTPAKRNDEEVPVEHPARRPASA